jgi:hypothetical protein
MVSEIRLYIEGGGDSESSRGVLREGFARFFKGVVDEARQRSIHFKLICCGGRDKTIKVFSNAMKDRPEAFNVLLLDADHPVSNSRLDHLKTHFKKSIRGLDEKRCHLMVQVMEAWFLADIMTLKKYYTKDFNTKAFPKAKNVETIDKDIVLNALKEATRHTQKGEYHKINHASALLASIRSSEARKASYHCDALFKTLEDTIRAGR